MRKAERNEQRAFKKSKELLLRDSNAAQELQGIIDTLNENLSPYALQHHAKIHRDFYRFGIRPLVR
jgi:hypothetical protein